MLSIYLDLMDSSRLIDILVYLVVHQVLQRGTNDQNHRHSRSRVLGFTAREQRVVLGSSMENVVTATFILRNPPLLELLEHS